LDHTLNDISLSPTSEVLAVIIVWHCHYNRMASRNTTSNGFQWHDLHMALMTVHLFDY